MKTGLVERIGLREGLGFRLLMMLSIALIPLGVIAVVQTSRVVEHAEAIAETALRGRTDAAAASVRSLISTALGAGQALGMAAADPKLDPSACDSMLRQFRETTPYVTYVAFASRDGRVHCASDGRDRDLSEHRFFRRLAEVGAPVITTSRRLFPGRPILVIGRPVEVEGAIAGYLVMTVVVSPLAAEGGRSQSDGQQFSVVVFNRDGEILDAGEAITRASERLPEGRSLVSLAEIGSQVIRATARDGGSRLYAVTPILPQSVYAVGSWSPAENGLPSRYPVVGAVLFPLAMWLVSLGVALFAVQRLVLRHIASLRAQMRRFALGERESLPEVIDEAPAEIRDVSQTFRNLAGILVGEERQLAESLREKTVLLREVHHRVKNNLQLIASIVNMQMRQVQEPEARKVLKSVQDRVASLATIHRNLYQAETLASVRADRLLGEIVSQMTVLSGVPGQEIAITTDFSPVSLNPDQSVPVALLTTEALTNAIKYSTPAAEDGQRHVRLSLQDCGDGTVRLGVTNSLAADAVSTAAERGTGLGSKLIAAFATQLDAEVVQGPVEGGYEVSLRFRVEPAPAGSDEPD